VPGPYWKTRIEPGIPAEKQGCRGGRSDETNAVSCCCRAALTLHSPQAIKGSCRAVQESEQYPKFVPKVRLIVITHHENPCSVDPPGRQVGLNPVYEETVFNV
jgi:hypothetical protein